MHLKLLPAEQQYKYSDTFASYHFFHSFFSILSFKSFIDDGRHQRQKFTKYLHYTIVSLETETDPFTKKLTYR